MDYPFSYRPRERAGGSLYAAFLAMVPIFCAYTVGIGVYKEAGLRSDLVRQIFKTTSTVAYISIAHDQGAAFLLG